MEKGTEIQQTAGFDYAGAVEELEAIVRKVEDPAVGIDDIDRYLKRSAELVKQCRDYLRSAREKADHMDTEY